MSRASALATLTVPHIELPRERFVLSCGAILLVSPRPGAPVTAVHAHVRGGPSLDPVGREGTAYLVGALADQGTARHDERELAELLETVGGEVSGDASGLSGTIPTRDWGLLVDLLGEILTSPTYPAREVARQRKRLLDRMRVELEEPRSQGGRLFRKLVYGPHWLGRPAWGSPESLAAIEPRHLRKHHAQTWVGSRAVIALSGDIEPEVARRRFEKALASWNPGLPLPPRERTFPERGVRVDVFRAARQQVHVYLGHLGIVRRHPDYPALVVMDHVLGTGPGFTNRIARRLRDELGLAYSVSASIHSSAGLLPGTFTAYIGTSPPKVETAVAGFLREIRRIQAELVEPDELEHAKSYLLGSFPLAFERSARRASYLVSSELHGFPPEHLVQLLESIAAVTQDDIRRVARAHLHPESCCVTASGPITRKELTRVYRAAVAVPGSLSPLAR